MLERGDSPVNAPSTGDKENIVANEGKKKSKVYIQDTPDEEKSSVSSNTSDSSQFDSDFHSISTGTTNVSVYNGNTVKNNGVFDSQL